MANPLASAPRNDRGNPEPERAASPLEQGGKSSGGLRALYEAMTGAESKRLLPEAENNQIDSVKAQIEQLLGDFDARLAVVNQRLDRVLDRRVA